MSRDNKLARSLRSSVTFLRAKAATAFSAS